MAPRRPPSFTPHLVVSRTPRGTLRSVSMGVPYRPDPFPDVLEEAHGVDFPARADVIVRQLDDDTWQLQDRLANALHPVCFDDITEARERAVLVAERQGGDVWLRSDRPERFERVTGAPRGW